MKTKNFLITLLICISIVLLFIFGSTITKDNAINESQNSNKNSAGIELKTTKESTSSSTTSLYENSEKSSTNNQNKVIYKDGSYTGTAQGFRANIDAKVTIKNGKIENVEIVNSSDDMRFFERAQSLTETIVEEQSTDIDVVNGATYSSKGILDAVKDALDKAK